MGTTNEPIPFVITTMRDVDVPFIRDSWRRSYRRSPLARALPAQQYARLHGERMDKLLARARVAVARPPEWPEGILGWAVADIDAAMVLLHYMYVKTAYRERGIGHALATSFGTRGRMHMSCRRPPFCAHIKRWGYT